MIEFQNYIKQKVYQAVKVLAALSLVGLATYSAYSDNLPAYYNITRQEPIISNYYPTSYKKAIKKSRLSAVRLLSLDMKSGMVSTFSGTYVKAYENYFVVTVAHGIQGDCEDTKIIHNQDVYDCLKYIEIDEQQDYAIIQIDEIHGRNPVEIPKQMPRHKEWKKSFSLLSKVIYSGYPNSIGPLTLGGKVAGIGAGEYIYVDSYAWQGSSGAGVFDSKGNYVGYIVAVDVGQTEFGIQILNNIVLVAPSYKINWTKTITEAE